MVNYEMIQHIFEITNNGTNIGTPISLEFISERYRNITLSQTSVYTMELNILKRVTNPINISINEAKEEANEFIDRLILIPNHRISSFNYLGYKNGGKIRTIKGKSKNEISLISQVNNPKEYYSKPENFRLLNKKDNSGVLRIFRTALSINDSISQYLILYGILLILKGENQKKVDKFIKGEIKDIQVVIGKNGDETIITRIRNMIAHPSNGLNMNYLNEDIDNYIETLKDLVIKELRK